MQLEICHSFAKEVPKIEVKQVEKVVEANGLSLAGEFWFALRLTFGLRSCTSQVPNIEYQDRLVEVREAPAPVICSNSTCSFVTSCPVNAFFCRHGE